MKLLFRGTLPAALMVLAACAALYPFDYYVLRDVPTNIGTEWTEISCSETIDTTRPDKELWLLLPQQMDVPNFHDKVAVFRATGARVEIFAEIVDTEGKIYPMPIWTQRGSIYDRPREGTYMRLLSDELPRSFRLASVRLRSSQPITLSEVLWTDSRSPGPPQAYIRP